MSPEVAQLTAERDALALENARLRAENKALADRLRVAETALGVYQRAEITAAARPTGAAAPDLPARIMRLPCPVPDGYGETARIAFEYGHKKARIAAANLAGAEGA